MRYLPYAIMVILVVAGTNVTAADNSEEELLPIGLTVEEMKRLDEIGSGHRSTLPPSGIIRNPAEWERSEGVIIRWPLGISISLVAEMSEDVIVTTIVANSSQQTQAYNAYASGGVTMRNTQFIIAPTNSIWTRDFGPWFIFENGSAAIVDHIYNRPRPYDDVIPQVIGAEWGMDVFGMDLVHTGGNHMSDGLGMSMSTRLVYDENPALSDAAVDSIMLAYLGNDYTVLGYIESGGIHHIDCWAKLINPTTILIKDVAPSHASYDLLNARAEYLSQQVSAWGRPYTIVRVYCPTGTAYTNSLILNGKVLVPIFSSSYDDDALQVYEEAMPGYEVLGFTGSWYDNDAIHCRAMGVPDRKMLFISHVPLAERTGDTLNDYQVSVSIQALSDAELVAESLKVYFRVDSGSWYSTPLTMTAVPDSFVGQLPAQGPGTQVEYYLKAADLSGRIETHPFIGAPWAHRFSVDVSPQITSADSIICKAGDLLSYCPQFDDPDDTVHTITYDNYPGWLGVVQDTLTGIPPVVRLLTGFTVSVSDAYMADSQDVALFVYICGDADDDGTGPNVADLSYLVSYLFLSGPPPPAPAAAEMDELAGVNVADLSYLVDYLFFDGPVPLCE